MQTCKKPGCLLPRARGRVYCSREHSPYGTISNAEPVEPPKPVKERPFGRGPVKDNSKIKFNCYRNGLREAMGYLKDYGKLKTVDTEDILLAIEAADSIAKSLRDYLGGEVNDAGRVQKRDLQPLQG